MIAIALLLLAAAPERTDLYKERTRIPKSQWRAVRAQMFDRPSTIHCEYRVVEGTSGVRAVLMTGDDVDRFQRGESPRVLASTQAAGSGAFAFRVTRPGEYLVLVDNRTQGTSAVLLDLNVWLERHPDATFEPRLLSRETRLKVVAMSLGGFLLVGGWSGWRVWLAWRRRLDAIRGFRGGRG